MIEPLTPRCLPSRWRFGFPILAGVLGALSALLSEQMLVHLASEKGLMRIDGGIGWLAIQAGLGGITGLLVGFANRKEVIEELRIGTVLYLAMISSAVGAFVALLAKGILVSFVTEF